MAGGLGRWLLVDPVLVRVAFAVLALAGGAGIVLYLLAWLAAPDGPPTEPPVTPRAQQAMALGLVTLGLLLAFRDIGLWPGDALMWPVTLAAAGSAVIWTRGDDDTRARWARVAERLPADVADATDGRALLTRVAVGGVLIVAGMVTVLATSVDIGAVGSVVVAVGVTAAGAGLILGPWILRLVRQLGDERRERIRSQERSEMAAHLHDSVLQTLAMMQRSGDPRQMVSLARRQERELRAWLYGRAEPAEGRLLSTAIDELVDRIEADHPVTVDPVVVGDLVVDDRVHALVRATSEAATNAARHAGVDTVSVYVEVEPHQVTAFVRDRGAGFDPDDVPPDRRGIADSIRGRLDRVGGTATITSVAGEGTEVRLELPREVDR